VNDLVEWFTSHSDFRFTFLANNSFGGLTGLENNFVCYVSKLDSKFVQKFNNAIQKPLILYYTTISSSLLQGHGGNSMASPIFPRQTIVFFLQCINHHTLVTNILNNLHNYIVKYFSPMTHWSCQFFKKIDFPSFEPAFPIHLYVGSIIDTYQSNSWGAWQWRSISWWGAHKIHHKLPRVGNLILFNLCLKAPNFTKL
jgi:hypothetical protein